MCPQPQPSPASARGNGVAIGEKSEKFWMFLLKAKIEKELGDKVAAKASAEKCIALATEQKNDDYVRFGNLLISNL